MSKITHKNYILPCYNMGKSLLYTAFCSWLFWRVLVLRQAQEPGLGIELDKDNKVVAGDNIHKEDMAHNMDSKHQLELQKLQANQEGKAS